MVKEDNFSGDCLTAGRTSDVTSEEKSPFFSPFIKGGNKKGGFATPFWRKAYVSKIDQKGVASDPITANG